jgi:hypothetical protein
MPIVSSCAFREGLRDLWEKMTQILENNAWNCYTGVARNPHRVCRRRSRALFPNTCQQRTCLHRLYKHEHKSYNIDRWTRSLRMTLRLIHHRMTTSGLEYAPLLRALSRALRPSHHPSSNTTHSRRGHQILSLSASKASSTGTVEGRCWNPIKGLGSSSL